MQVCRGWFKLGCVHAHSIYTPSYIIAMVVNVAGIIDYASYIAVLTVI